MLNLKLKTKKFQPIGLDIGHDSVKMVQFVSNEGKMDIVAASKVKVDSELGDDKAQRNEFIKSSINKMLARNKFDGVEVVSCLPCDQMKMTSLRLSDEEKPKADNILKKEMSDRFGFNLNKDQIDYIEAGQVKHGSDTKTEYMMFAAYDETIREHIDLLDCCGLRPVSIDIVPCALFRSFMLNHRRAEDLRQTSVFIDMGSKFTTVIFCREGQINFVKQIPMASEYLSDQIASRLNVSKSQADVLRSRLQKERLHRGTGRIENEIDPSNRQLLVDAISSVAEELAREVSLCFKYYTVTFRGKTVEKVVVTGGCCHESILTNTLKRYLGVNVDLVNPLKGFGNYSDIFSNEENGFLGEWAVAVGLSMKGHEMFKLKN